MARLVAARSTDILFPEEGTKSYQSDYSYRPTPQVTSHTSSYSREVSCIFESKYCKPNQSCSKPPCATRNNIVLHSRPPRHDNHNREQATRYRQYNPPPKRQYNLSPHQQPRKLPVDHNSNIKEDLLTSRRRTWSPPAFDKAMGSGTSFNRVRACRSNDHLDNNENIYESLDPPPLAPSGTLDQTSKRAVIKPVAFKPVVSPSARYVSTPQSRVRPPDVRLTTNGLPRSANHSHDDGYGSQDYSHIHSSSNISHNSSGHGDSDRSLSLSGDQQYKSPVFMSSNISGISSHVDHFMHTPSPSDSGVGELEAMLRDKDAEINQLRETIEVNERAIIQVYEEKIQNLQVEVKEVHDEYEARLRQIQEKGLRSEQALYVQICKLQQDCKSSKSENEKLITEKDKAKALEKDFDKLKTRLEEIEWELCQKTGEISLLKTQLKESKDEIGNKSSDMLGLKSQIKDLNETKEEGSRESQRLKQELQMLQEECESAKNENEKLRSELEKNKIEHASVRDIPKSAASQSEIAKLKEQLASSHESFEKERDQWHLEKDKVIRYQKQLQLNYVQMCRKNRMLEQEVQQLTLELENRDISLMPDSEGPVEQESVC